MSRGRLWGDDIILCNEQNFLPYLARAINYCDVQFVAREKLLHVLKGHPESARVVRRAACFLALRRTVIRQAKINKLTVKANGQHKRAAEATEQIPGIEQ